jgi:hypothetical protein
MYRNMEKILHGICACIQHPFSAVRTALAGKPSAPFERAVNFCWEISLGFYIYFVFSIYT